MIINVPIYLEVEGKFTPQEGRELTLYLRRTVIDYVRKTSGGYFNVDLPEGRKRIEILSEAQAINRFGTNKKVTTNSPQKGVNPNVFSVEKKGDSHV